MAERTSFCELCWMVKSEPHDNKAPHKQGPKYPCSSCPRVFSSQGARYRHFQSTDCENTFCTSLRCPICSLLFDAKTNRANTRKLQRHLETHKSRGTITNTNLTTTNTTPTLETTSSQYASPSVSAMSAPLPIITFSSNAIFTPETTPSPQTKPSSNTAPTASNNIPAVGDTVSSVFCKLCWKGFRDIEKHNRTRTHLKGHEVRCNRCVSERWFSSKGARKRHMASNTCSEYDEHRCCDCDISFPTAKLLSRHKKDITIHPPRAVPAHIEHNGNIADLSTYLSTVTLTPHVGPTECPGLGCNRLFSKPFSMLTHIESGFCRSKINRELIDNIIIANDPTYIITNQDAVEERAQDRISLASSEYSDSINGSGQLTPSDMDSNFEEFDSDVLTDDSRSEGTIVPHNRSRALDPDSDSDSDSDSDEGFHFVTGIDVQHHAHLNTPSDSGESHGHSFMSSDGGESGSYLQTPSDSDNGVYFTPSDSEDGVYLTPSDSESGVYLTPSNSEISEDAINQILSLSGGSGLFTPPTDSIASPLQPTSIKCPLCPTTIKAKEFANLEGLHTHLRSMVHQQKIYHCPFPDAPTSDTTVGGGGKAGKRKKGENKQTLKSFSALSALGQHVDAGSCKNGKDRFEATVAFLHEKLKEMGVADV